MQTIGDFAPVGWLRLTPWTTSMTAFPTSKWNTVSSTELNLNCANRAHKTSPNFHNIKTDVILNLPLCCGFVMCSGLLSPDGPQPVDRLWMVHC